MTLRSISRYLGLLAVACVVVLVAWLGWAGSRPLTIPGTVRVIDAGPGKRLFPGASDKSFGTGWFEYDSESGNQSFHSDQWPDVGLEAPIVQPRSGHRPVYLRSRLLRNEQGRTLLRHNEGHLVLREPSGRVDLISLNGPGGLENLRYGAARWSGDELEVLVIERPVKGPHKLWLLKYAIGEDEGRERSLLPTESICLDVIDPYWADFCDDGWVAFAQDRTRSNNQARLVTSSGDQVSIPKDLKWAFDDLLFQRAVCIDPSDGIYAVAYDRAASLTASLHHIPVDGSKSSLSPLKLPVNGFQFGIDDISPDGRYLIVRSLMLTVSGPWPFPKTSIRPNRVYMNGLSLVDLEQWAVVASLRWESRDLSDQPDRLAPCLFSYDGKRVLVSNYRHIMEVDIQEWIDSE